jgi:hypothetical protein
VRIRLHIQDADVSFVEEKLGRELYSHFRGLSRVAAFRIDAVARAQNLYEEGRQGGLPEPEVAGRGLLVLQRTMLCAEDLGSVLWALSGDVQGGWLRLTSYRPDDLDGIYRDLLDGDLDIVDLWSMPTNTAIEEQQGGSHAQRAAVRRFRGLVTEEIRNGLEPVAAFWLGLRVGVKATMHGFSVLAAEHLIAPPGAGVLGAQFDLDRPRPFAASLVSTIDEEKRQVETTHHLIDLTPRSIADARNVAERCCELLISLAAAWLYATQTRHAFVMDPSPLARMTADEQEALAEFFDEGADDAA